MNVSVNVRLDHSINEKKLFSKRNRYFILFLFFIEWDYELEQNCNKL